MNLLPDQPDPWMSLVLACLGVIIVGISKSGFGGGLGIVAVPIFVLAFGSREGLATLLPLMIAADVLSVYHHRGTWDKRNLKLLLGGSLIGIAIGAVVLGRVNERWLELLVGVICLSYLPAEALRRRFAANWRFRPGPAAGTAAGIAAGVATTLAHAAGPIVTSYLLLQDLRKQTFLGTAVLYYFVVNVIKLVPYGWHGMIHPQTLWQGLWLLPLVPIGTWIGSRLARHLNETVFRRIILLILLLSSVHLIVGQERIKSLFDHSSPVLRTCPV